MPILVAEGLRKAYGETRLLDGVDLSMHQGERIGLVGNNGSGKSTLARILAGEDQPDEGRVARRRETCGNRAGNRATAPGLASVTEVDSIRQLHQGNVLK